MNISQAKTEIKNTIIKVSAESQCILNHALKSLDNCGDDATPISEKLEILLADFSSIMDNSIKDRWAENVYIAVLSMKRRQDCREQLKKDNEKIDGETAQWVTTIAQGIMGVISIVVAFLFVFEVIPKGRLGELGKDGDSLYFVIGTIGQQLIALIIAIIIGCINRYRIKRKYKDIENFEDLLEAKYEGKPIKFLLHPAKVLFYPLISIVQISISLFHIGSTVQNGQKNNKDR